MCAHGSGLVSPLTWTNLFVTVCAQPCLPFPSSTTCALNLRIVVLIGLFMVVRLCLPTPGGVSAGGATTLSQVVVQPATSVLRSHVCSAVLLWAIWPFGPAFGDLRAEWCDQVSVSLDSAMFWVRHSWIFNPRCSLNSMTHILAHVSFVGQVCERFLAL